MQLTQTQIDFLERYVIRRRMDALGIDPVPAPQAPGGDAGTIRGILVELGGATDVDAPLRAALQKLQREGLAQLSEPLTKAALDRAARIAATMRDLHAQGVQDLTERRTLAQRLAERIALCKVAGAGPEDVTELANAARNLTAGWDDPPTRAQIGQTEQGLTTLETRAGQIALAVQQRAGRRLELLRLIEAATVPLADEDERASIGISQATARETLPENPSPAQIEAAELALRSLQQAVAKIGEAVQLRRTEAGTLRKQVADLAVEQADTGEAQSIREAQEKVLAFLKDEVPSAKALGEAATPLAELRQMSETVRADLSNRLKRRDEIVQIRDGCKVERTTTAEAETLRLLVEKLPDLTGFPSRDTIKAAELALGPIVERARTLREAVEARGLFSEKVKQALEAARWGSGALVAPGTVPVGLVDPVKERAGKILSDHAMLCDPARPDEWPTTEPGALDRKLQEIASACEDCAQTVARINDAATRVADARTATGLAIASTKDFALSSAQKLTLNTRADNAAGLLVDALSQADAATDALGKVTQEAITLQRALRALAQRIAAVNLAPPGASDSEKKALSDLHETAVDALGEVEP